MFEEIFLLFGEVFGGFDDDGDDMGSASIVAVHEWGAMAGEFEGGAGLGAGRNFHNDGAVNSVDGDFGAESGVDHGDFLLGKDDDAFASEGFVRFDTNLDVEVTRFAASWSGTALAREANGHAVFDAGRNFNFEGLILEFEGFFGTKNGFLKSNTNGSAEVGATGSA